jgi:hypothetical protein
MKNLSSSSVRSISEQVSSEYLSNGIPMNKSIAKVAEERGLNKHYVERIVEQSNQLTYLSLFDKGTDKYASATFELADASSVIESIKPKSQKVASPMLDDYEVQKEEADVSFFGMDKAAEEKILTPALVMKAHSQLKKQAAALNAEGVRNGAEFDKEFRNFCKIARQAALRGKLSAVDINSVFPEDFAEKVAAVAELPNYTKDKLAEEEFCVNELHPLIESYNKLSVLEDEYIVLSERARVMHGFAKKAAEETSSVVRGSGALIEGIAADIAKAWNVIKEVPAKHLVGYPAAFLLGVMYAKNKEQQATLTSDDVPLIYRAF